jgi:pimeloyl-ACP methyl ester carboxylesterase
MVRDDQGTAYLRTRVAMTPEEAAEGLIALAYAPTTPRADIDADLAVRTATQQGNDGYAAQLADIGVWGSLARLPGLAMPTLLIHGDIDRLSPVENSRRMAAVIPGMRLEVIPGAGHVFWTDQPERTRAVLESFLIPDR